MGCNKQIVDTVFNRSLNSIDRSGLLTSGTWPVLIQKFGEGVDLHRLVLHTDLPAPYCFDCKSAAHQERQELLAIFKHLGFKLIK